MSLPLCSSGVVVRGLLTEEEHLFQCHAQYYEEVALSSEDYANIDNYESDDTAQDEEVALTEDDFANIHQHASEEEPAEDVLESGLFEGDINLGGLPIQAYQRQPGEQANALLSKRRRWPKPNVRLQLLLRL